MKEELKENYINTKDLKLECIAFAEWIRYSCFANNNVKMSTEELYEEYLKGSK